MVEFVCELQFFSVKSFVLTETKSRPLLWMFSRPLFWIRMRGAPLSGEGCGTRQAPTLPHIFFHFGFPVIPLVLSLAICGGITFELLTVIFGLVARSLCSFILETCVVQGGKWELRGKKAILLFQCIMFICENKLVALDGPGREAGGWITILEVPKIGLTGQKSRKEN